MDPWPGQAGSIARKVLASRVTPFQWGGPMSDPHTAADLERDWLAWLGQRNDRIVNYLNSWNVTRALTPAELQGIVGTLDQHLQELINARPTANDLSRQGAGNFAQRLEAAIQDFQGTRNTFQQMYVSTAATQAQIAEIRQRTSQATQQIMGDIAADMRSAQSQNHQRYIDVMNGNCFVCHTPIGVPGGGYCSLHVPRTGPVI
jgi:hypothetical protein